ERQLGVHPLEPGVLRFQVLDTPQLGGLQAAVLRLPLVVGRNADAGLPADVLDRHAGVGLLEDRDDLGLGETGLLHGTSWLGKTCQKVLLMGCLRIGEAYARKRPAGWQSNARRAATVDPSATSSCTSKRRSGIAR